MGRRFGRWELEDRLGAGGMGEVWAVRHARWGQAAALKLLRPDALEAAQARAAFDSEIRSVALMDHPHVVRILDQGTDEGQRWFVMERAAGPVTTPASWPALRRAVDELLQALGATHGAGVLHLDVKPSNLLVRRDGTHALADFGIARLAAGADEAGARWGSPPYMAPERFDQRSERLTEATDLYAVGCVAWFLACQRTPYGVSDWSAAARAHRTEPLPALQPRIEVPAGFEDWVRTALARRPGDRFASAAAARRALSDLSLHTPLVAPAWERAGAAGVTLTATAAGDPVAMAELLGEAQKAPPLRVPARWPDRSRAPRLHAVGLGLMDLLPVPFTGRAAEREVLWDDLRCAAAGETRARVIRGPVGVGRTRLGEELVREAVAEAGATAVRIPGDPEAALWRWLGLSPGSPAERIRDAAALRLGETLAGDAVHEVVTALQEGAIQRAWAAAVERLAARGPTIAWMDDLLADDRRLALFEALTALDGHLLVLAAVGTGRAGRAGDRLGDPPTLELGSLDEAAARRLLADWVGLDAAVVADVARRCEGDIGLALAMIRAAVDAGRLQPSDAGLVDTGSGALPMPTRPGWSELLPSPTPAIARAAALGAQFPQPVWERAVPDPEERAEAEATLAGRGLLGPVDDGWRWASPVPRLALLADDAEALVAAAGAWEGREHAWRRGQLLLEAGRLDEALPELFRGASDAIASGHMAEAARLHERVERLLEERLPRSSPHWGRFWRSVAMVGPTHQGYAAVQEANRRALELARAHPGDPAWEEVRRDALGGMIWLANVQYLPRRAGPLLEECEPLARAAGKGLGALHDNRGWYRLTIGDARGSMEAFTSALEWARERDLRRLRFVADASLGVAMRHAGHPDAVAHLERSGEAMLDAGYISATADLYVALGDAERDRGHLDRAREHYEIALRAHAEGEARADPGTGLGLALLHRQTGRLDEAREAVRACIAQLRDEGPSWEGMLALHLASVEVLAGVSGAWDPLPAALDKLERTGFVDPDLHTSATLLLRAGGPHGDRLRDFVAAQRAALRAGGSRIAPVVSPRHSRPC